MNSDEVLSTLLHFFSERSDGAIEAEAIDPTAHLFDAGYVDSMNSLTLLDFIEKQYGVELQEVDLVGRLNTLSVLAEHVAQNASGSQ